MHGQSHQPVTVEAIQLAYHGRKDTRLKVYELRTKAYKEKKKRCDNTNIIFVIIINIITIIIMVQIYMMFRFSARQY
jgi:heme/copper-type cytochrome/quinol oxidase subunit 2